MTYLQLLNRLKNECGVAGADLTSLSELSREMQRLANWVAQSYEEIQEECLSFDFRRKSFTFNTVAGTQTYAVGTGLAINLTDFATWINDSFRIYLTADGVADEILLDQFPDYTSFRDYYMLGTLGTSTGRPSTIAITPNKSLAFGLKPDDVYTVTGEYYSTPQTLTASTDVPLIPARFHMAIVYKAMMKYGLYESAQEQVQAGQQQYAVMLNRLRADQTPMVQIAGSMI